MHRLWGFYQGDYNMKDLNCDSCDNREIKNMRDVFFFANDDGIFCGICAAIRCANCDEPAEKRTDDDYFCTDCSIA